MKTAVMMAKLAAKQGVRDIICTTHIAPGIRKAFDPDAYEANLGALREYLAEHKVPLQLRSGSEIMYCRASMALLEAGRIPTLAETGNVLIEFDPRVSYIEMQRAAVALINAGFDPIYAHVERYGCLREGDRAEKLRDEYGVRFQLNAGTVIKNAKLLGDPWVKRMLKHRRIDIVASDAHNAAERPCRIAEAFAILEKKYGADYARDLCSRNPYEILKQ